MKKSNLIYSIIVALVTLIFVFISYNRYKTIIDITIYSTKDSYATSFADKNFLEKYIVTTTEKEDLTLNIENFEYIKKEDGTIKVTKYLGVSEKLVIPDYIDNLKVTQIDKSLFANENIKGIYISKFINDLDLDNKNIEINCYNNDYCLSLAKNNNVFVIPDSTKINFNNTKTNFSYEIKNNEVEIVNYQGKKKIAIIPTKINGYNVTKVSCDAVGIDAIYIPDTVKKISNNFTSSLLNRIYITVFVSLIIALVVIIINVYTLKNNNLETTSKNSLNYMLSSFYLLLIGYLAISITDVINGYKNYLLTFVIITIIYEVLFITIKLFNKKSEIFEKNIKNKTSFINEALCELDKVDEEDKFELKEIIRYSDPVSIKETKEIEQEILNLIRNLDDNNAKKIKSLIKTRNNTIKKEK